MTYEAIAIHAAVILAQIWVASLWYDAVRAGGYRAGAQALARWIVAGGGLADRDAVDAIEDNAVRSRVTTLAVREGKIKRDAEQRDAARNW